MPAAPSEKSRKHVVAPYTKKPGPKGPRHRNQPASSSRQVKQPSKQLTNYDWLAVFAWIDTNPPGHRSQQDVVDHFANRRDGPLRLNQASLSRKLKKRGDIEATVKANPAALSARRQRIVVSPKVERALVLWVEDMLANGRVVNGLLLTGKRKTLEEKFNIPPEKRLTDRGWLQRFYRAYGLKEHRQHGEAASADPEDIASERAKQKELNARYKPEDRFNGDETYVNPFNPPNRGMAMHKISGKKKNKFRITIFFACNATGTEKLPPFFIGKSAKPHCFQRKTGEELGFYYRNNKKAWMTAILFEEWIKMFDEKMRAQGRKVCLHLDNFSGHYISYEPTNVELMFFKPNLTAWVQPLDAGIIRCFKAHYRRRFCQEALKRDASGEADIYSFNLLEALHMARDAWENVTPETIKNCWNHADIQRDPIILRIPSTLTQRGWNVIHKFADPPSGMTLPQAEDSLKEVFGNQYNDDDWRPALTLVTETEPDEDIHSLIKALREKPSRGSQPFTPNEYTEVAAEVTSEIKELERRNRIFEGAPSADAYIEPDVEREVEVDQIRTDDELVAEVVREQAIERGEIVEKENEECEEEEPEMTTREIMSSITRLRKALLTRGDLCVRTAKMLALAQDEVAREEMRNARQMTLEWWFGGQVGHSE